MCEWDGENGIKARMIGKMVENLNWFNQNYHWKGNTEIDTIKDFAGYSSALRNALRPTQDKDSQRKSIIQILVIWGGTITLENIHETENRLDLQNYQKSDLESKIDPWFGYCENPILQGYLNNRNNQIDYDADEFNEIIRLPKEGGNRTWRIASWSKILAALAPGKFFIYDSRVAIALSDFCLKNSIYCFWQIPPARDNGKKNDGYEETDTVQKRTALQEFINACQQNRRTIKYNNDNAPTPKAECMPTCYYRYHNLLKTLAGIKRIQDAYSELLPQDIKDAYEGEDKQQHQAGFTREQAIMAHIEKMLFMRKEDIL